MTMMDTAIRAEAVYVNGVCEDVKKLDMGSAADRARAASIIMRHYGDPEMADTLSTLSGQLDFGDSSEAADAIGRTQTKLDALIKDREARRSSSYIHMLTAEQIKAMAGGEVTDFDYSLIKSRYLENGLFDPDIFGGSGEIPVLKNDSDRCDASTFGTGMGFITFPCHVVLPSSYRTISWLLKMKESDVEKVARYVSYVVVDPGKTELEKGDLLQEKDYQRYKDDALLMTGGDAIHMMLCKLGYADCPERLAFDVIPVAAPCVRLMFYREDTDMFCSHPLNREYDRVINRARRVKKLREMNVPDIIDRNECRMLNECVESLMNCIMNTMTSLRKRKDNTNRGYRMFRADQLSMARMMCMFPAKTIKPVKTGDIKSLGLYPEMIKLLQDDGTKTDIDPEYVYDKNVEVIGQARTDNAVVIPEGYDPDDPENLPPELQEEINRADELINSMEATLDQILDGAKEKREQFTVKLSDNGLYVPC